MVVFECFFVWFVVEYVCYGFELVNCVFVDVVNWVWLYVWYVDFNLVEVLWVSKMLVVFDCFCDVFVCSFVVIVEMMCWVKNGELGVCYIEYDFVCMINDVYGVCLVVVLMFLLIVVNGVNSVFVYYMVVSVDVELIEGEFVLFDSGVYYEVGFVMDCICVVLCCMWLDMVV